MIADDKKDLNFEELLVSGSQSDLDALKAWLFKENIRLEMEKNELRHLTEKLNQERSQFRDEMDEINQQLVISRKRLKQDEQFFDKKMEILKNGFTELDIERKRLQKEQMQLDADKNALHMNQRTSRNLEVAELLFQGVTNQLALKKRYKDLLKMFHPDNLSGDSEMVVIINRIYETLKDEYENGKWA